MVQILVIKKYILGLVSSVFLFLIFNYIVLPKSVNAQFAGDLGAISGSVKWGLESLTTPPNVQLEFRGNVTGFNKIDNYNADSFNAGFILPADTYTIKARTIKKWGTAVFLIGEQTVTVSGGQTVNINMEPVIMALC